MELVVALSDLTTGETFTIEGSKLIDHIKTKWDEIHSYQNIFRYKIDNIEERIVDNRYLLQLNPNRLTKRRTPEQIENICQKFDISKFNFMKISKEEIIIKFEENDSTHIFTVNVSPISRYHTLLCPSVNKLLPQVVTVHSLKLVIDLYLVAGDCDLRIAFNSLCAWASVNHLHYHFLFEKNQLPVETVKCKHIKGPLYCLEDYTVPAFCFEITRKSPKVYEIYKLIEFLLHKSIAHNVFITRGDSVDEDDRASENNEKSYRFLIYPRKSSFGAKQFKGFNIATCELSGWIVVHSTEDFFNLQGEQLDNELKKWRIENFEELCEEVKSLYK